jgi:NADPH:quinone reductase-like Zn-dependent oxidoreductase
MRAIVLEAYREDSASAIRSLWVAERPVPKLRRGQVLVRIEAAPCNPSDLLLLQGKYGQLKSLPTVPGWEGAGTVVASGGGVLAGWLKGKRVACALQGDRDGTWAEYFAADAAMCIPIKRDLPIEQAAALTINPLTVVGLLDTARRDGHHAAVHTAAASQLGRMLLEVASDMGFPLIHVVRRDAQVELMRSLGAEHVLNSSSEGFAEQLAAICDRLNATAAFEAVAGEMTGVVLHAMPPGSTVYVYGALSEEDCRRINPIELIFQNKTVTGFFLGDWAKSRGTLRVFRAANRLQRLLLDKRIETKIQARLRFDSVVEGLQQYVDKMTDGKVLITP